MSGPGIVSGVRRSAGPPPARGEQRRCMRALWREWVLASGPAHRPWPSRASPNTRSSARRGQAPAAGDVHGGREWPSKLRGCSASPGRSMREGTIVDRASSPTWWRRSSAWTRHQTSRRWPCPQCIRVAVALHFRRRRGRAPGCRRCRRAARFAFTAEASHVDYRYRRGGCEPCVSCARGHVYRSRSETSGALLGHVHSSGVLRRGRGGLAQACPRGWTSRADGAGSRCRGRRWALVHERGAAQGSRRRARRCRRSHPVRHFGPQEGTAPTFAAPAHVLRHFGRFAELDTHRSSHFGRTSTGSAAADAVQDGHVRRALRLLGIRHILARSPEARGCSECAFGTLQGLLPH